MNTATMFSGGGLVDTGMMQAGHTPIWAVEFDAAIADVYRRNVGDHVIVADVADVDYSQLPGVDWLHASPSCKHASRANRSGYGETEDDIRCAAAVVRALTAQHPRGFTLENVWEYRNWESFRLILNAMADMGYMYDFNHTNMAAYSVPQNRWRLFLVASRGLLPTIQKSKPTGWLAAIEDLVPDLKESKFSRCQLKSLERNKLEVFAIDGTGGNSGFSPVVVAECDPIFTITASFYKKATRMQIGDRVLAASPRCYARWQTMPDSYNLPTDKNLACEIIGNGVPCEFIRRIGASFN